MRLSALALPLFATTVWAGWFPSNDDKPQPATSAPLFEGATPNAPPAATAKKGFLDYIPDISVERVLTSGPIANVIQRTTGFNVTEKFETAKKQAKETGWHPDIPLITDENYKELIVNEALTSNEMEERVWIILVSIPNGDQLSKFVDEKFDATYNLTQSSREKALPKVKWGRIDYLDVTHLTTKWCLWKAPYLVIARKGGRELRFYNPRQLRLVPEVMHRFLKEDGWKETKPWTGALAPGGSLERPLDMFASFWTKVYIFMISVPKWVLLLITGGLASAIINVLHRGDSASQPKGLHKRARIASSAKKEDGGSPVRRSSPEKEDGRHGRRRSESPSKRVSARIAARSMSPVKQE